jgi:serine/threonine-protein kinase
MSPEQVRGKEVDHRTDIFALGTILYEMLSGRRAFRRDSAVETMNAILKEEPPDISLAEGSIPPALALIVRRCLEKTPEERFQSARDLGFALESISAERREAAPVAVKPEIPSIAVLPFADMSSQKDQDYFCEGMAEEIINALAKVEGLRVAARTSSFQFKGKALDINKAGEVLKVRTVLEGSVRTSGNRLRVTAQLINVDDGYHLWSERYDRQMDDVFDIQDEITSEIVQALKGTLLPAEAAPQFSHGTQDLEAYHFYLKGQYSRFTRYDFVKAGEHFLKALKRDPSYAPAYVGMADIYNMRGFWGYLPPQAARTEARAALDKALAIDDRLGEAYSALGYLKFLFHWDWDGAEKAFQRGIELDPAFVPAYTWYGYLLACVGRLSEAIEMSRRAQERDPLSPHAHAIASLVLLFASRSDEAVSNLEKFLEMQPNQIHALSVVSHAYSTGEMHEKAIAAAERVVVLTERGSWWLSTLGGAYARRGRLDDARQIIRELEERAEREYIAPTNFSNIYLGLANKEKTIFWLERAYEQRDPFLIHLRIPLYDPIRSDPRFQDLMRRMNLD